MSWLRLLTGSAFIIVILWDVFETIVLPRRVKRKFRLTRLFYRFSWIFYARIAGSLFSGGRRENFLSYYGPLSLILLLILWAAGVVTGFALVHSGIPSELKTPSGTASGLCEYLYFSGTNFFTLGLGDILPLSTSAKVLTVLEAGIGLGLLALVIGYLPSLNQSFSRRETHISLLDARAGSPPTAGGMILRQCQPNEFEDLSRHLLEWEGWCAELLESHLSYPVLAYFRSQHQNQSWLAAVGAILDACSLLMTGRAEGSCARQARLTFAIARHVLVDLSLVFFSPPRRGVRSRLTHDEFERLKTVVEAAGIGAPEGPDGEKNLARLREMYEPYLFGLSHYFQLSIPSWMPREGTEDNWEVSAWDTSAAAEGKGATPQGGRHF